MSEKHSLTMPSILYPIEEGDHLEKRLKMTEKLDGTFCVREQTRLGDSLTQKFILTAFRLPDKFKDEAQDEVKPRNVATGIRDVAIWKDSTVLREYATEDEAEKLLNDFDKTVRDRKNSTWKVGDDVFHGDLTLEIVGGIQNDRVKYLVEEHNKDQLYIEKHGLKL